MEISSVPPGSAGGDGLAVFPLGDREQALLEESLSSSGAAEGRRFLSPEAVPFLEFPMRKAGLAAAVFASGERSFLVNLRPSWDMEKVPGSARYPFRGWCWILPALGALLYFLLPMESVHPGALRYRRFQSVLLADLLGFSLGSFFFWMPFFISAANGWDFPLMGGNVLVPVTFWIPEALVLGGDEIRWNTLSGWKDIPLASMRRASIRTERARKLPLAMMAAALFLHSGWRLIGPALLAGTNPGRVLSLETEDGWTFSKGKGENAASGL